MLDYKYKKILNDNTIYFQKYLIFVKHAHVMDK